MSKPLNKYFYLIRGIPGCGKTTFAKSYEAAYNDYSLTTAIIEANDYFMQGDVYNFNPVKLTAAHEDCIERTKQALTDNTTDVVIVTNTFIYKWELEPYFEMMEYIKNITLFDVITAQGGKGNPHNVPDATIRKMKRNFEELPTSVIERYRNIARESKHASML